jgi:VIT1/CCC1 family predicted Fe2+/Mn2+ transporter
MPVARMSGPGEQEATGSMAGSPSTSGEAGSAGSERRGTPPQSGALVWTVLTHVLFLPLAGAFLPMLMFGAGPQGGFQVSATGMTVALALVIAALHGFGWYLAGRAGERRLQYAILLLGATSLASLVFLATPSPLVGLVHIAGLFF